MIKPYIPRGFSSNCYLIVDKKVALVDTGLEPDIEYMIRAAGGKLDYIINTHCHFDHIGMNRKLQEKFGAEIMMHEEDAKSIGNAAEDATAVTFFTKDLSAIKFGIGKKLKDGDVITLGKLKLKVIHTPGHTRGSICLLADDALFSGDTVFSNGRGRTDLYGGSESEIESSIKRLSKLKIEAVYPGHGEIVEKSGAKIIKTLMGHP